MTLTALCYARSRLDLARWDLMGEGVDHVVHAHLVGLVREVDGRVAGVGPLPELADVAVVGGDGHEPLLRIIVLEDAVVRGLDSTSEPPSASPEGAHSAAASAPAPATPTGGLSNL